MTTLMSRRRRLAVALARLTTTTAVAAAAVALAPTALAADSYGAIAYANDGSWGRSKGYPTKAAAEATAVKSCGHSDCKVITSFTNCGAVAKNDQDYKGGTGPDLSAAMKEALSKVTGGYIDTWECN